MNLCYPQREPITSVTVHYDLDGNIVASDYNPLAQPVEVLIRHAKSYNETFCRAAN